MSTPAKMSASARKAAASDTTVFATKEDIQEVENDISNIQKQAAEFVQRLRTPRATFTSHHDQADIDAALAKYGGGSTGPSPRDDSVYGLTDRSAPLSTESRPAPSPGREPTNRTNESAGDLREAFVEDLNRSASDVNLRNDQSQPEPITTTLIALAPCASTVHVLRTAQAVHFRNLHAKLTLRPPPGGFTPAHRFAATVELLGMQRRTGPALAQVDRQGLVHVRWAEGFRFPVAPETKGCPKLVVTLRRVWPQGPGVPPTNTDILGRPAVCPLSGLCEQPILFEMNVGVGNISASVFVERQSVTKNK